MTRRAHWEDGESLRLSGGMIAPHPYGELFPTQPHRCGGHACGLWTATFTMDSGTTSRARTGSSPPAQRPHAMFRHHAGEDFALDKGGVIFTGGAYHEEWGLMAETWLWLYRQYFAGRPRKKCPDAEAAGTRCWPGNGIRTPTPCCIAA